MSSESQLPKKSVRSPTIPFIVAIVIASFAFGCIVGFWMHSRFSLKPHELATHSSLTTEGVEAYWDKDFENKTVRVDWGNVLSEASEVMPFYLRNVMELGRKLYLSTEDWEPAEISHYMNLSWNYNDTTLHPDEAIQVTLTLSAPNYSSFIDYVTINCVKNCSFNIIITTFPRIAGPLELTSGWEKAVNVFPQNITDDQKINYTLKFLYRDESYERIAHLDASLMYAYFSQPDKPGPTVYVDLEVASNISNLLALESLYNIRDDCEVLDSRDIQLLEDTPLIARFLTFGSPENYTQVTLYWYEKATFNRGVTVEQRYVRISLIILTRSQDYAALEEKLLAFGKTIAVFW